MRVALLVAAVAAGLSAPALADFAPGRTSAAPGWIPASNFPTTPAIQRYGKGAKGLRRFQRGQIREAEFRRFQEDNRALRSAAAGLEDSRGRCDQLLKQALESGDRAEIEEKQDFCRPHAYGPQLR